MLFERVVFLLLMLKLTKFFLWLVLMMLNEIVKNTKRFFDCSILMMLRMVLNLPSVSFVSCWAV